MKLTKKQKALADKCSNLQKNMVLNLVGGCKTYHEAYMKAGGTAKTKGSQLETASQTMKKKNVQAFYQSLLDQAASKAVMTKQQALERLTKAANASIFDVCDFRYIEDGKDKDGNVIYKTSWKIKDDIAPEIAVCIKSVTMTSSGPKIELYDSHNSIKQLSDMLGWNAPRRAELTGKDGEAIALKADVESPEIAAALAGLMDKL